MRINISGRAVLIVAAIVFAACYLLWAWYRPAPAISTAGFAPVETVAPLADTARIPLPVKAIQVIPKATAAKKLKLPVEVAQDERQQVLTAVAVPPTQGGATAVTIIDTTTGAARTIVRETPRPLIGLEVGTEVGARYGLASDGQGQRIDLYARRDLLRIGPVYLAAYAEVNTRPEIMGMLDVSVRWQP